MASKTQLVVGLDAGSSRTRCVICALEGGFIRYLGHGLAPAAGWAKGRVTDQDAVAESIRAAVTDAERGAQISVDEFRTFNRCLDNAIAGAVTEFARITPASNDDSRETLGTRLGPQAQELRNLLKTAILAVTAMKAGSVGTSGATAAVLEQSLMAMHDLIDPSPA